MYTMKQLSLRFLAVGFLVSSLCGGADLCAMLGDTQQDDALREFECAICLEDTVPASRLITSSCGHKYCYTCMADVIKNEEKKQPHVTTVSCPLCRKDLARGELKSAIAKVESSVKAETQQDAPTTPGKSKKDKKGKKPKQVQVAAEDDSDDWFDPAVAAENARKQQELQAAAAAGAGPSTPTASTSARIPLDIMKQLTHALDASHGDLSCFKSLLKRNVSRYPSIVNAVLIRKHGLTPLHIAASKNDVEFATWLLDHNADINIGAATQNEHVTALSLALYMEQNDVARLFYERGANTDLLAPCSQCDLFALRNRGWVNAPEQLSDSE